MYNQLIFKFILFTEVEYNFLPPQYGLCIVIPSKEKSGKKNNLIIEKPDRHHLSQVITLPSTVMLC